MSDVDFDVSLGFVTNFGHKQLTRSAGRETGSTSDEENSRDIQILIWSHQNSCTCQKEDKLDPVGSTVRYEMMKLCTGSV